MKTAEPLEIRELTQDEIMAVSGGIWGTIIKIAFVVAAGVLLEDGNMRGGGAEAPDLTGIPVPPEELPPEVP
jgi:hypothetical protein